MDVLPKSAASVARVTRSRAAFELRGVVAPLTVLRLRSRDLNLVDRQLRTKIAQMPSFFEDAPVVLDLSELEGGLGDLPVAAVVQLLRAVKVVPVGVTNVSDAEREATRAAGIPVLHLGAAKPREPIEDGAAKPQATGFESERPPATKPAAELRSAPASAGAGTRPQAASEGQRPSLVVREAVRGGQVIYARNADLIVLAPVNAGAQVFADGHIHVYSVLRGRAMAGAGGMTEARIFVQRIEAEMVAIAGAYVMADDLQGQWGKAAQVQLEHGECRVTAL